LEVEKISPLAVKLTARWHQRTLLMWVVIDVLTGDLIIRQEGFSDQTGISTIGWGIGNLDYDQVSPIVPGRSGKIMNEQHTVDLYWMYPGLWEAPLAVVQGTLGGCFVMSEDETDQFKALGHWPERKKPNLFAIAFNTHNFLPFENRQHITSAIWRFNTYRGDWQVPAERYRQGMMERNASRVARPPAWVKDIQLVVMYCSLNRNYIRMLDFLAQQINPKNVLLFCRSGWYDGEQEWPDVRVREDLPVFMSAAKQHGFRVMLYTGFQFVSQTHPLYPQWESFLYRGSDGHILGELELGGPAIINPAASSFREYYVRVLKNWQSKYNFDAIHLDLNYFIRNHEMIDGLTPIQGNMLLHEELIEAMPDIVFSGEFIHAVTSPYVAFYGTGDNSGYGDPHPISDFLFSQWSPAYSGTLAYLGDRHKAQELEILNLHIKTYKQLDVVPTIRYYFEHHLEIQQAISILHRTNSNAEFWEELEQMVNTPREDLNFDGVVNILDLQIVANAFGDPDGPDLNFDGVVNIQDLVIVANAFE
ncbi:MAG: hypothetical protein OXC79_00325, partial [Candidatus Poribacteria bacterium]|nr:hypothetical protein [Candidatus Poribacteria bacterium]